MIGVEMVEVVVEVVGVISPREAFSAACQRLAPASNLRSRRKKYY